MPFWRNSVQVRKQSDVTRHMRTIYVCTCTRIHHGRVYVSLIEWFEGQVYVWIEDVEDKLLVS